MYIIQTEANKKPLYISGTTLRKLDNRLLPDYTQIKDDAEQYASMKEAKQVLQKIHNPCDHVFGIGPMANEKKRKAAVAITEDLK